MKKPKVEQVNLPYASTAASFFGDQGSMPGKSFMGRLFSGGGRQVVTQGGAPAIAGGNITPARSFMSNTSRDR